MPRQPVTFRAGDAGPGATGPSLPCSPWLDFISRRLWLLLVLFVFTLLYPVAGLRPDANQNGLVTTGRKQVTENLTYRYPFVSVQDARPAWRARLNLVINSGLTSLEVALL